MCLSIASDLLPAKHGRATFLLEQPTKVDSRLHEPEALADLCTSKKIG
jgi:hypothetical protein